MAAPYVFFDYLNKFYLFIYISLFPSMFYKLYYLTILIIKFITN